MAEIIERKASRPDGDLACDFTLARDLARTGFREELARGIVGPVREIADGIEVTFRADAWEMVRRYVEVESECCAFLDLTAQRGDGAVLLRVTGRPDARDFIANIFARADSAGCC